MSAKIGKVASVSGVFSVSRADGSTSELTKGDEIFEGDIIDGAKDGSNLNSIVITLVDGSDIVLIGDESQFFDSSLLDEPFAENETITDTESMQTIVDENFIDEVDTEAGEESADSHSSTAPEANFAEISDEQEDITATLRDIEQEEQKSSLDNEVEDSINPASATIDNMLSDMTDLIDAARAASLTANEISLEVQEAAQAASENPTVENLAAAERVQNSANIASIEAANAAQDLEEAIADLNAAAISANILVDTSDAEEAVLNANDASANARDSVVASELATDNEIAEMLESVADLTDAANLAAQNANSAAVEARNAAAVADVNPTPENLEEAELAQESANTIAIAATNAANELEEAIKDLDIAAEAADEIVDTTDALEAVGTANDAASAAVAAAIAAELQSDADIADLLAAANAAADVANTAVVAAQEAADNLGDNPSPEAVSAAQEASAEATSAVAAAQEAATTYTEAAEAGGEIVEDTTEINPVDAIVAAIETTIAEEERSDADIAEMASTLVGLISIANVAAQNANALGDEASEAVRVANENPTPDNLTTAQNAQEAAAQAATNSVVAASSLEDALTVLNEATTAAGEDVNQELVISANSAIDDADNSADYANQNANTNLNVSTITDMDTTANVIDENVVDGTYTGVTVNAVDIDGEAVSYTITDDVPFRVEADGRVVVDGDNAIDYEANRNYTFDVTAISTDGTISTQSVTVDVADVFENVAPEANDYSESSYVSVNETGVDGALVVDSRGDNPELLGGATSVDVTMSISGEANQGQASLFSYASPGSHNEFLVFSNGNDIRLYLDGANVSSGISANELFDGEQHEFSVSWDSATGEVQFYLDGNLEGTSSIGQGHTIDSDGVLMLGQEQDSVGGSLAASQIFSGDYYDVSIATDGNEAAHWDMNNIVDGEVIDSVGQFNLGTVGDVTLGGNAIIVEEDSSIIINSSDILTNDTDADGDSLSISAVEATADTHGTVSLDADGNIIFTPEPDYNGEARFSYTVSDGHGGESSATVSVNVDSINDLSILSDNTIADATPTIIGNGETGSTVVITNAAGETLGTTIVAEDGTYSITTDALEDGIQELTITSTNTAGDSTTLTHSITVDAGVIVPTVELSDDSNNSTNDTTPTINGTAEAGSEVVVRDGTTIIGTTTADAEGNWSIDSSELSEGIHHINVTTTDIAGNVFEPSGISALSSGYDDANRGGTGTTVNDEFHRTSRGVGVTLVDEDGNFVSHETFDTYGSSDASTALVATLAEINENSTEGSTVVITTSDEWVRNLSDDAKDALISIGGSPDILGDIDSGDYRSSYQLIAQNSSDGWESESENFHDRSSDGPIVGHSDSSMNTIIIDTRTTSSIDLSDSSDTGISSTDNITNDNTLTLTAEGTSNPHVGVGERGASVVVTNEDGEVLGSARVNGNGNYSITLPEMEDGVHSLTVTSTDAVGNVSTSTQSVTIDTVIEATSDTNSILEDDSVVTGNVSDNDESGSFVTAETIEGTYGTIDIAEDGSYVYTLNSSSDEVQGLDDGESVNDTFTYTTTDVAGNTTTSTLSIDVNGSNDTVENTPVTTSETVFSDDFSDGNADGWSEISFNDRDTGRWDATDGSIGERSNAADGIIAHDMGENSTMQDYSITVDVDANSGNTYNNDVGITFGYEDSQNYFTVQWVDYSDNYSSDSDHKDFNLVKVEDGHETVLDTIDNTDLGTTFNLSVDVSSEGGIVVSVDGVKMLSAPTESPEIGTFGLNTGDNDGGISYDNVVVQNTNVTENIPSESDDTANIVDLGGDVDGTPVTFVLTGDHYDPANIQDVGEGSPEYQIFVNGEPYVDANGESTFSVTANRGVVEDGVLSRSVDDYETVTFKVPEGVDVDSVSIKFINDAWDGTGDNDGDGVFGEDRNLVVDKLNIGGTVESDGSIVGGTTYEAEDTEFTQFIRSDGADVSGIETMAWNGEMTFYPEGVQNHLESQNDEFRLNSNDLNNQGLEIDGGEGLDTLVTDGRMEIDFSGLSENIANVEAVDLGASAQNITSLTTADVLDMTDTDNLLRIDGDSRDSIDLNTQGDDAEWTLGDFKTDAETGVTYQEVTGVEDDATVTLEISTDINIEQS